MPQTFQPLTQQQYQSARAAGFSASQIIQNEQTRKSGFSTQTPTAAAPQPTITGPTGGGILSSIGKAITGAGVGIGSEIGKAGLGLGQLAAKGIGAIAGLTGGAQGTKTWNDIGDQIGNISNSVYDAPATQTGATAPISTSLGKGAGIAATILAPGRAAVGAAKDLPILAQASEARQAAKIAETVAPKLTPKTATEVLATGGATKSPILGTIKPTISSDVKNIADTVKQYVPNFSAKNTLVDNINATRTTTDQLAADLKSKVIESGKDRIYPIKELAATLRGIERPLTLVGDNERIYNNVVNKALEIVRAEGGKVSDLFQARKVFDGYIRKAIPNLYDSAMTPMRQAISGIRNGMTDFTIKSLPKSVPIEKSMTAQTRLLNAIENMAEKAASGSEKEIGTTRYQRFARKHPLLTKIGGAAGIGAAGAIGAGGIYEGAKEIGL